MFWIRLSALIIFIFGDKPERVEDDVVVGVELDELLFELLEGELDLSSKQNILLLNYAIVVE